MIGGDGGGDAGDLGGGGHSPEVDLYGLWTGGETSPILGPVGRAPVGRNEPCPCGSGNKFKKCCLGKTASAWDMIPRPFVVLLAALVVLGVVLAVWN